MPAYDRAISKLQECRGMLLCSDPALQDVRQHQGQWHQQSCLPGNVMTGSTCAMSKPRERHGLQVWFAVILGRSKLRDIGAQDLSTTVCFTDGVISAVQRPCRKCAVACSPALFLYDQTWTACELPLQTCLKSQESITDSLSEMSRAGPNSMPMSEVSAMVWPVGPL